MQTTHTNNESIDDLRADVPSNSAVLQNEEVSLLELLILVGRRKKFIAIATFVIALATAIVSLIMPASYKAETTILPPQQNSSAGAALMAQLSNLGPLASMAGGSIGLKNPNDMYVAMLKSRTVETAMVQRFGLMQEYEAKRMSDAIKMFESRSTVSAGQKDGLIHISVEDRDPRKAADITNGYVQEFKNLSSHLAITEASQRRLFFEQQLSQAKDNLANAEEAMKVTESKTGLIQLDSQARALIESVAALRAQIAAKEIQIQTMSSFATANNPDVMTAQQQLAAMKEQLARLGGSQAAEGDVIVPKGKVPEAGTEYIRKLRDVKYYETIFELLARQFEMAKLDEARQGAIVQVVDPAVVPDRRSSPKRTIMVLVAIVLGLILSTTYTIVAELIASVRKRPEYDQQFKALKGVWGYR